MKFFWNYSDLSNKGSTHFIRFGKFSPPHMFVSRVRVRTRACPGSPFAWRIEFVLEMLFYLRTKKGHIFSLSQFFLRCYTFLCTTTLIRKNKIGVYVTIYTALISQETLHKTINNETSEKNLVKPKSYWISFAISDLLCLMNPFLWITLWEETD